MIVSERCALVLWGAQCDEAAATIFITALRAVGLRVWIVGVSGRRIAGNYGIRIQPDLTTGQALPLACRACCVVIPCVDFLLSRFLNDPHVDALLQNAAAVQAQFVISSVLTRQCPPYLTHAVSYPPIDTLFPFATTLAATLTQGVSQRPMPR
jgi:hypothetical protein